MQHFQTPENFEKPPGRLRLLPDAPFTYLGDFEKRQRQEVYGAIQGLVKKVEMLGTDNAARMSYHQYFTEDGSRRVLFYGAIFEGVGRTFRLMVNDETSRLDGGRDLYTRDYLINAYKDVVTKQAGYSTRGHHDNRWQDLENIQAPFMRVHNGRVVMGVAADYELRLPYGRRYSLLEQMDMYPPMCEVRDILGQLNKVTREDGVTNEPRN